MTAERARGYPVPVRVLLPDPYETFVIAAAVVAAAERARARRNEVRLLRDGGEDVAPAVYRWMVPIYVLVFVLSIAEHRVAGRRFPPAATAVFVAIFVAAKALKLWVIRALGDRWTMRVVLPRTFRVVTGGPYRFVRHPNYVAVLAEVTSLPLIGGAAWTSVFGGASFFVLLAARVRTEERALFARAEYREAMGDKARFVPGPGR